MDIKAFQFLIGSLEAVIVDGKNYHVRKFQFLIGSLEARLSLQGDHHAPTVFQFLIGSLEAWYIQGQISSGIVFQFLIGSLEALTWNHGYSLLLCFNSS